MSPGSGYPADRAGLEIANDPVLAVGFLGDERHDLSANARQNRALYVLSVSIITDSDRLSVSPTCRIRAAAQSSGAAARRSLAATAGWTDLDLRTVPALAAIIGDPFGIVARTELASSSTGCRPRGNA